MDETSSRNHVPLKCQQCVKSSKPFIHNRCRFCQDLGFEEDVFCYLNKSTQSSSTFKCYAFQPVLKLVEPCGEQAPPQSRIHSAGNGFEQLLDSDKVKYQRALALQKLGRDPDHIFLEIKYHFAWNVIYRKPVFSTPGNVVGCIRDTFAHCSEAIGGSVKLLWLAPDHIHLYVESDGKNSPDAIAQTLKRFSVAAILEEFPGLVANPNKEERLWDEVYFVETIG